MVEHRAGRDRLVGVAHLAEDLALAGHERIEPGGDAEEVERRLVFVQPVEDAFERLAGERLERRHGLLLVAAGQIQLGAVARREADGVTE